MANKRLAKLLDAVIPPAAYGNGCGMCVCCNSRIVFYGQTDPIIVSTRHQRHCPIPRLRKERYEATRERETNSELKPLTRSFLREQTPDYFRILVGNMRRAIFECERGILDSWPYEVSFWRNRKAQLEYNLSQIKRELYHRKHTRKEGRASCKTNN